ncbi:MAG: bifunctional riboflavin kinase/FAD synthetase [Elusimicrobiota bacterium]
MTTEIIAIGMFDGVHLGHQQVLKTAVNYAKQHKIKSAVLTFDYIPTKNHGNLTTLNEKAKIIRSFDIDKITILQFGKIKNLTPQQFIENYLKNCYGIVVGCDFKFGKDRQGNLQTLKKFCKNVISVKPVKYRNKIVSSTLVKKKLISGNIELSNNLLGRNYTFEGKVIKGSGLGKKLGFPTANLTAKKEKILPEGIFISKVKIGNKKRWGYRAITYIGRKPTLGLSTKTVEIYILGFKQQLYNKKIVVELLSKIRDDKKFPSVKKLAKQIENDLKITQGYFEKYY